MYNLLALDFRPRSEVLLLGESVVVSGYLHFVFLAIVNDLHLAVLFGWVWDLPTGEGGAAAGDVLDEDIWLQVLPWVAYEEW